MNALKQRLQRATLVGGAAAAPAAPARQDVLFPFSAVEEFLKGHTLIRSLSVTPKEVHTAVLHIHKQIVSDIEEEMLPVPRCVECKVGYIVLDRHEATHVCDECGLVQHRGSVNINPEFTPAPTVRRGTRPLHGIPLWRFRQSLTNDTRDSHSSCWNLLEHHNVYVNLTLDDLKLMDGVLMRWSEGGCSVNARVAGALLYLPLSKHFPSEKIIRERVRSGNEIPQVDSILPTPKFSCESCGTACFTQKDARYCCKMKRSTKRPRLL